MATLLPLSTQTLFSELSQRSLDAAFEGQFPENGSMQIKTLKGRKYAYYQGYNDGRRFSKYVGPVGDPDIEAIVANFKTAKGEYAERRNLVRLLRSAGLPTPTSFVGEIINAMWRSGFFRLRGVLIGTTAFQAYAGFLGAKLPNAALVTNDVDFAQFHSISFLVGDSTDPILPALQTVDPTFREIGHMADARHTIAFANAQGFKVEFLAPNRGSDDHTGRPSKMPALSGASATALRYLDFLIYRPVRTVLIHGVGVPITVPAPERYAVHKMIVASVRSGPGLTKASKDIAQSGVLIDALWATHRGIELGYAWIEAWERGPKWRAHLNRSLRLIDHAETLKEAVRVACTESQKSFGEVWPI